MEVPGITLRLCRPTRGAVPKEQTLRTIAGRMLNVGGGSFDCRGRKAASNPVPKLGALIPFGIEGVKIPPEFTRADVRKQTLAVLMNIFQIAVQSTRESLAERLSNANLGINLNLQGCGVWGAKNVPASDPRTAEVRPAPIAVSPSPIVKKAPKAVVAIEAKLPQIQPGKHKFTAFEIISLPLAGLSTIAGLIGGEISYYLGVAKLFLALDFVGAAVSFIFFCALAGIASARRSNIMMKGLIRFNEKAFGENSDKLKQELVRLGMGRGVPMETYWATDGHERTVVRREEQELLDDLFKKYLPGEWVTSLITSNDDGVHRDLLYYQDIYKEDSHHQIDLLRLRERLF